MDQTKMTDAELWQALDEADQRRADGELPLDVRIRSFETAFHMQTEAREVFDVEKESDDTMALYGMKRGQTDGFGWQCLVARRLAERGVRFIERTLASAASEAKWTPW